MFRELGPDARGLLGIIAFSNRRKIFDKFTIPSLTYRSNDFIKMLAPLREYLSPKEPASSPLLCTTEERYFSRLPIRVCPGEPGFEEARWITLEDVNIEHLLDIFTTIDENSNDIWDVCYNFMQRLY